MSLKLDTNFLGSLIELLKYGSWGIFSNIAAYLTYLLLTFTGIDPKLTVAIIAPIFILIGFFVVRNYIFHSNVIIYSAVIKYIVLCVIGNLINILLLFIFVDLLHYQHQVVQLLAMIIVGILFFFSMKYFIFK